MRRKKSTFLVFFFIKNRSKGNAIRDDMLYEMPFPIKISLGTFKKFPPREGEKCQNSA